MNTGYVNPMMAGGAVPLCTGCNGMGYMLMNGVQTPCNMCCVNVNNNYGAYNPGYGMGMGMQPNMGAGAMMGGLVGGAIGALASCLNCRGTGFYNGMACNCGGYY